MPSLVSANWFSVVGAAPQTIAANPTDWITLTPGAARVVGITNVMFFGTCPTPVTIDILLLKRSALNTGGTSSSVAATPTDEVPTGLASNASVLVYTANPSILGTLVGVAAAPIKLNLGPPGAAGFASLDFGTRNVPALKLRSANHQFAVNLNGVSLPPNALISCRIEEYEEQ
jgi:hypothetical protein